MNQRPFHVLIVGGGIGGLCLAQGLKQAGISVAVYERDRTPDARLQGYRLNIEPIGARALQASLPTHVWNLLVGRNIRMNRPRFNLATAATAVIVTIAPTCTPRTRRKQTKPPRNECSLRTPKGSPWLNGSAPGLSSQQRVSSAK
jgi:choline dehydrogenase-like flavoprotein